MKNALRFPIMEHKEFGLPLNLKSSEFRLKLDSMNDDGTFVGSAAVYNNVDDGGDIIEPGAFKQMELTRDGAIRILFQHNTDQLMGKGRLSDNENSLRIEGKLNLNVGYVKDAYEFMKDGTLDGLSIGYQVQPGGARFDKGVRHLTNVKLWEVSVVTFGMNTLARVDMVKHVDSLQTPKEIERFLRDVGLSRSQAKGAANGLLKDRAGREVRATGMYDELRDLLKNRPALISTANS